MSLQVISIPPASGHAAQAVIVILHGWGANAADLAPLAEFLNLPDYQFYLPNAPWPHPQVAGGLMWYDLWQNQQGLPESRHHLKTWLTDLPSLTGLPLKQTVLAGFSQGGAMTLDVGLNLPLAGLISWSGYLHAPVFGSAVSEGIANSAYPPVLMVHGRQDAVVPLALAHQAQASLNLAGVSVQYHEFEIGHEILPDVLSLSREFIQTVLGR
ncbi:MAG: alpha/beta hydrolase [Aphanocapsa sp. GSE-SYN-MK-11-07L]|nr:alpha/beta hydrolase [Aphanocapsa sp. GSE-SYN-MK-11-07L]